MFVWVLLLECFFLVYGWGSLLKRGCICLIRYLFWSKLLVGFLSLFLVLARARDLIFQLYPAHVVIRLWEQFEPIIMNLRIRTHSTHLEPFEFLYNEAKKRYPEITSSHLSFKAENWSTNRWFYPHFTLRSVVFFSGSLFLWVGSAQKKKFLHINIVTLRQKDSFSFGCVVVWVLGGWLVCCLMLVWFCVWFGFEWGGVLVV